MFEELKKKRVIKKILEFKKLKMNEPQYYYLINSNMMNEYITNKKVSSDALMSFYKMCISWDNSKIKIPIELGMKIESMISNKDNYLFIHRTTDFVSEDIMTDGLFVHGQKMQGANENTNSLSSVHSLSTTLSPIKNMMHAVINLKTSFNHSNCGIFISLPSNVVDDEGNIIGNQSEILQEKNDVTISIKQSIL